MQLYILIFTTINLSDDIQHQSRAFRKKPTDQMMRNIEECVKRTKLSTHRRMNRCPEENTVIIHPHGVWKEREKRVLGQAYSYFDMTSRAAAHEQSVCTCVPAISSGDD